MRSAFPADEDKVDRERELLACGPAGSVIIYNGSICHGHSANHTNEPRRSIQGAYIGRDAAPAINFAARIHPGTLARIGPLARYLLDLDAQSATE